MLFRSEIKPLSNSDVGQLIADTLRTEVKEIWELSELCYRKTGGNPFFLGQMLRHFHEGGHIRFDPTALRFHYTIETILKVPVTDNVVDIILEKLRLLPEESSQALAYAALIGAEFNSTMLARSEERRVGKECRL